MNDFYVKRGDSIFGPFTSAKLKAGVLNGQLKQEDLIGKSNDGPWTPAAQVGGLEFSESVRTVPIVLPNAESVSQVDKIKRQAKQSVGFTVKFAVAGMLIMAAGLANLIIRNNIQTESTISPSRNESRYESSDFQNADSKVQEDIIIYDILRQQGYSDSEAKDAVIDSMRQ